MSDSNHLFPVFVATGVAVLGCAAAFYFSDSDTSTKRRKQYPIHTKDFDDDDLDSYDGDFPSQVKHRKKRYSKTGGGDEEEEEEEEEEEDDDEEEDEEEEEEEEEEDEDGDEGDRYLVNKRVKKAKTNKSSRSR